MDNNIAIFMQDCDRLDSFWEATRINVYQKENHWIPIKEILLSAPFSANMQTLRKETDDIIKRLESCKIIAGKDLSGIPFSIFDKAGFHIFSINQLNDTILDDIVDDIRSSNIEAKMKDEIIKTARPIKTDIEGIYFLDLIMLQMECPETSSKQALKEFLQTTPFLELRLKCKHIPPWLENGIYDITQTDTSDGIYAILTKKQCNK